MLLAAERDAVPVVGHCVQNIIEVLRVENVSNIYKERISQSSNPLRLLINASTL